MTFASGCRKNVTNTEVKLDSNLDDSFRCEGCCRYDRDFQWFCRALIIIGICCTDIALRFISEKEHTLMLIIATYIDCLLIMVTIIQVLPCFYTIMIEICGLPDSNVLIAIRKFIIYLSKTLLSYVAVESLNTVALFLILKAKKLPDKINDEFSFVSLILNGSLPILSWLISFLCLKCKNNLAFTCSWFIIHKAVLISFLTILSEKWPHKIKTDFYDSITKEIGINFGASLAACLFIVTIQWLWWFLCVYRQNNEEEDDSD
ncbi:MAG: hypothetical protein MHPSP_000431 [Paramarteilia canceri]